MYQDKNQITGSCDSMEGDLSGEIEMFYIVIGVETTQVHKFMSHALDS